MILPFWNSELYVEISSWFPFGKDYHPASLTRFYDDTLKNISEACLDLDSEFFFMASPSTGCVGSLPRENFFKYGADNFINLGFLMVLGYSEMMEKMIIASIMLPEAERKLNAGITVCSLWSRGVFLGTAKVIAVAADEPFFDGADYLQEFSRLLTHARKVIGVNSASYFAEKFGYDRFFVRWENEEPYDLRISEALSDFEFDGTREITGTSPIQEFPPFLGATLNLREMQRPPEEE